jgi:hypothetical protein
MSLDICYVFLVPRFIFVEVEKNKKIQNDHGKNIRSLERNTSCGTREIMLCVDEGGQLVHIVLS